jgi:hypothetical protein
LNTLKPHCFVTTAQQDWIRPAIFDILCVGGASGRQAEIARASSNLTVAQPDLFIDRQALKELI